MKLQLTFLYCVLSAFSADPALELKSITTSPVTHHNEAGASNIILQSKDGGKTWQDISEGLPDHEKPESFFAGESGLYTCVNNVLYRSKSNLKTPVWEKENVPDPINTSIAFNRSGVMAYNYKGQIYQRIPATSAWLPVYTSSKNPSMHTIFETSAGTVFVGSDNGLYKSADKGKSWKQVQHEGWVMDIVESEGVLIGTGEKGIMRSTDNGEHWQWVISEGGVGIAVERIEGGFAAISYNGKIKSRRIHLSFDGGKTWKAIDEGLRPSLSISSIKQVGNALLCGHPDGIFHSSDMGKTWTMVHAGVEEFAFANAWKTVGTSVDKKVFKLFVAGNTVYAVVRDAGC